VVEAHQGDAEPIGAGPGQRPQPLAPAPDKGDEWLEGARVATERVLRTVVEEFLQHPYLHRVEQSLHAWLFSLLIQQPELSAGVTLSTGEQTQLVHKEWPETIPGVEGGTIRAPAGCSTLPSCRPANWLPRRSTSSGQAASRPPS